MNLKLRLKNKATLTAIVLTAVAFIYQILGLVGVVPPVSEEQVTKIAGIVINLLAILGILVDPTTAGVKDSARAMTYEEPTRVTVPDEGFKAGGEHLTEADHEAKEPEA